MSRKDRDRHFEITNAHTSAQFKKHENSETYGHIHDPFSLMQYQRNAVSGIDIQTKDATKQGVLGISNNFSLNDLELLKDMYNCESISYEPAIRESDAWYPKTDNSTGKVLLANNVYSNVQPTANDKVSYECVKFDGNQSKCTQDKNCRWVGGFCDGIGGSLFSAKIKSISPEKAKHLADMTTTAMWKTQISATKTLHSTHRHIIKI